MSPHHSVPQIVWLCAASSNWQPHILPSPGPSERETCFSFFLSAFIRTSSQQSSTPRYRLNITSFPRHDRVNQDREANDHLRLAWLKLYSHLNASNTHWVTHFGQVQRFICSLVSHSSKSILFCKGPGVGPRFCRHLLFAYHARNPTSRAICYRMAA